MSEIHTTILSMKNNKTPSPDGILTEFLKHISILIVALLLGMFLIKKLLILIV